jgi:hypothetical protein
MIALTHNTTPVSPGQALDAWLAYKECRDGVEMYEFTHLFADALYGHSGPMNALSKAGIEIRFGE